MKPQKKSFLGKLSLASAAFCGAVLSSAPAAQALDQIIRPYQSVRSAGMGGVRLTTGLYEENFFGNPARITANPRFRVTVADPTVEINSQMPNTVSKITGDGDKIANIASTAGNNNHGRVQMTQPAVFIAPTADFKWGIGVGIITSIDTNIALRRNFAGSLQAIADIGPAVTVGRKFLEGDALSVGVTAHATYRVAPKGDFQLSDAIKGSNVLTTADASAGAHIDFDLGGTYELPYEWNDFKFTTGAAINNLLGGTYSNLNVQLISSSTRPRAQPRTFGFGGAARRKELGPFTDFVAALEFTDIGNNPNGSLFRTIHMGGEAHWGILAPRLGIYQGYLAGGLGVDLRFVTLDLATYGEEMSLNAGGLQDRRYAFRFALQI